MQTSVVYEKPCMFTTSIRTYTVLLDKYEQPIWLPRSRLLTCRGKTLSKSTWLRVHCSRCQLWCSLSFTAYSCCSLQYGTPTEENKQKVISIFSVTDSTIYAYDLPSFMAFNGVGAHPQGAGHRRGEFNGGGKLEREENAIGTRTVVPLVQCRWCSWS